MIFTGYHRGKIDKMQMCAPTLAHHHLYATVKGSPFHNPCKLQNKYGLSSTPLGTLAFKEAFSSVGTNSFASTTSFVLLSFNHMN